MQLHASCCARNGRGLLITGPSGSGKSSLVLRLVQRGFALVADDRVVLDGAVGSAPPALAGILEVRGIGLMRLAYLRHVSLALVVALVEGQRLPNRATHPGTGLPLVSLHPHCPSLPERVILALHTVIAPITPNARAFA